MNLNKEQIENRRIGYCKEFLELKTFEISHMDNGTITRVPGGYVVSFYVGDKEKGACALSCCFVPYQFQTPEFQTISYPFLLTALKGEGGLFSFLWRKIKKFWRLNKHIALFLLIAAVFLYILIRYPF